MHDPEAQTEADAAEHAAVVDVTTLLVLQAEAIQANGVEPRLLADSMLMAAIALLGRCAGLEQTPALLRKAAAEMERTFPLERSLN